MMYESKRHIRNFPFLWLLPFIIVDLVISRDLERTIILLIVFLASVFQWLRNDTFYYFTDEVFIVKGFFRYHMIPLKEIKSIHIRKNPILKQVRALESFLIICSSGKIIATPSDRTGFLEAFFKKTGIALQH